MYAFDPCRTLVEKLVLLHTADTSTDPHDAIRGARHYYDVHQLGLGTRQSSQP